MANRKVLLVVLALSGAAIVIALDEMIGTVAPPDARAVAENSAAEPAPAAVHEPVDQSPPTAALHARAIDGGPGTPDLAVSVASGGSVTATFLPDPLIELLEVRLVPPEVPASDWSAAFQLLSRMRGKPEQLGDRVRFHWTGLDPGWYRFVVQSGIRTLRQFDICVGEGEVRDPRLLDIDVRNQLRVLRVQVTDLRGERLPVPALLYVHGSNDPDDWSAQQLLPGGSAIATFAVGQAVDLFVVANGWRGRKLSGVAGDVNVALRPAPKFTLRCAQLAALPDVTARLSWMLATPLEPVAAGTRTSGWRYVGSTERALFGEGLPDALAGGNASGTFTCPLPLAVNVEVRKPGRSSVTVAVQPAVIDGDRLADGQTIELTFDESELREALEGRAPR